MQTKKCFKCGRILPLEDFYKHPQMKDGHLNKCKDCTRIDVKRDYDRNSSNESWMEKERLRGREKFHRLGYSGLFKKTRSICPESANMAKNLRKAGYNMNGKEAHHWNYNKPNSVFILSRKAHRRIHQHMSVNYDDKYCYTEFGERIDDETQAENYFKMVLDTYDMKEDLELVIL